MGAKVLLKRLQFIQKLNSLTSCLYREISGLDQTVKVHYESEIISQDDVEGAEQEIVQALQSRQREVLSQERRFKRSLVGPHRDDFSVTVEQKDLRYFGSQGEQRTAVLALKLSEWETLEVGYGKQPLFLLDDIASELDEKRKEKLFQTLKNRKTQLFVTTTDVKHLDVYQKEASLFHIEKGRITKA